LLHHIGMMYTLKAEQWLGTKTTFMGVGAARANLKSRHHTAKTHIGAAQAAWGAFKAARKMVSLRPVCALHRTPCPCPFCTSSLLVSADGTTWILIRLCTQDADMEDFEEGSEEAQAAEAQAAESMPAMLNVMWKVTVIDVERTLKVCTCPATRGAAVVRFGSRAPRSGVFARVTRRRSAPWYWTTNRW
jgi:hypothetical protein